MTERFAAALGRKVISRASAEEIGKLTRLVVDVGNRRVTRLVVGKGRKARLVEWDRLAGFGPDALVVDEEAALRAPSDDADHAAVDGDLELLGKRALSELGDESGAIDDISFDPATGELIAVFAGSGEHPAAELLGAGSYAVVLGKSVERPAIPGA